MAWYDLICLCANQPFHAFSILFHQPSRFFGCLPPCDEFLFVQTTCRVGAHDHRLYADLKMIRFAGLRSSEKEGSKGSMWTYKKWTETMSKPTKSGPINISKPFGSMTVTFVCILLTPKNHETWFDSHRVRGPTCPVRSDEAEAVRQAASSWPTTCSGMGYPKFDAWSVDRDLHIFSSLTCH